MTIRVALVGGPMYDHLYEVFTGEDVEVVVHADHPTLNREVARRLADGERIDLLATHSKYAPSQTEWLQPLDGRVDESAVVDLAPGAVESCRFEGVQWCLPRLVDVRILWARSDRIETVPATWTELADSEVVFGFPGRESGLFGTFFELVVGLGGRLFDDDAVPAMASPESEVAVETLRRLAARAPHDLVDWHYDEVDRALLDGRLDAAAAWPGGWGAIRDCDVADSLRPHRYPAGPAAWVSYAGCHAWAIPTTCSDQEGALELLHRLLSEDAQALDAAGGNMCANEAALESVTPVDAVDGERLAITRATIAEAMIAYPPLVRFPEIEDAGWSALRDALLGRLTPPEAVTAIQAAAVSVVA